MHTPNHLVAEPGCSSDITPNLFIASADLQASFSFDLSEFASVLSTSLNVADEIVVEPVTSVVLSGKPDLAELSAVLSILQSDQPGLLEGSAITSVVPSGQPFLAEIPASQSVVLDQPGPSEVYTCKIDQPMRTQPKGKGRSQRKPAVQSSKQVRRSSRKTKKKTNNVLTVQVRDIPSGSEDSQLSSSNECDEYTEIVQSKTRNSDVHLPPNEAKKEKLSQREKTVSYTHLRAHETDSYLVCRLLLESFTGLGAFPVSYTHLTLPTIYSV